MMMMTVIYLLKLITQTSIELTLGQPESVKTSRSEVKGRHRELRVSCKYSVSSSEFRARTPGLERTNNVS